MNGNKDSGIVLESFSELQILEMLIQYHLASEESLIDTSGFPRILVIDGLITRNVDFGELFEEVRNS